MFVCLKDDVCSKDYVFYNGRGRIVNHLVLFSQGLRTRNAQKMMGPMAGTMTPIKAVTRKGKYK